MQLSHSRHDGLVINQTQAQMEIIFSGYRLRISAHLSTLWLKVDAKSGIFALEAIDPFAKRGEVVLKKEQEIRTTLIH